MAEDLRRLYADAVSGVINEWATRPGDSGQFIGRLVAALMAVRDEELQRLRANNEELRKRAELAEAAIVRVREDHGESVYMPGYCFCANAWPCPTVRALNGRDADHG